MDHTTASQTKGSKPLRAGLYLRISRDAEGEGLGVQRQEEDARALAERRGYEVVRVFKDNDIGASTRSRKARPGYAEMIETAKAGQLDVIVAYSNSRLTRRPREFEDLIDLVERHGIGIVTCVSGDFDLTTADGRMMARTVAAFDAGEAERTGERVARAIQQRAEQGKRHGFVPYGWRLVDGQEVLDPEAARVLREAATRILDRESLRSVWRGLNDQGVPAPRGGRWDAVTLRQLLLRQRNCGRRIYKKVVTPVRGSWEPLWDDAQQDSLIAVLRNPARRTNRGSEPKYLLSGIARCGKDGCDGVMRVGTGRQAPAYFCKECMGVRRKVEDADEVVIARLCVLLARPEVVARFGGNPNARDEANTKADLLQEELDTFTEMAGRREIGPAQLGTITASYEPQIAELRALADRSAPTNMPVLLKRMLKEKDPQRRRLLFEDGTLEERRVSVRTAVSVTILPQGPGRKFDSASVAVSVPET